MPQDELIAFLYNLARQFEPFINFIKRLTKWLADIF